MDRNGKDVAVLISVEDLELLELLEDRMDIEAARRALEKEEFLDWEEFKKESGAGLRYTIKISRGAAKEFKKLEKSVQKRVQDAIDALGEDPRPPGVKKLKGSDELWRVRVGTYRVIYSVVEDEILVLVLRIRHRKDAY